MIIYDILGPLPNCFLVDDFSMKIEDEASYEYPESFSLNPKPIRMMTRYTLKVTASYFLPYCGFTRENLGNIHATVTMIDGRNSHSWDGKFPITERVGYQVEGHRVSASVQLSNSTLCFDSYDMTIETQRINLCDPGPALEQLRARLYSIAKQNRMIVCSNKTHLLFLKA